MDHDGQPHGIRRLAGAVQRGQGVVPRKVLAQAGLDADDHVAVALADLDGLLRVDEPQVFELADDRRDHARRRDVETGLDARFRDLDDVAPEALEGVGAGRSGVDSRGDAAGQDVGVGVDAVVAHAVVDVHVDIDETGRDQQTLGIDDLAGLGGVDALRDRAHAAARDRHVARGLKTLRGVDDGTAGYQEVVHRKALP